MTARARLDPPEPATVVEPIRLANAGLAGSPSFYRDVEPGARVDVLEALSCGLLRVSFGPGCSGVLVDREHVELDDPSRPGELLEWYP